MNIIKHPEIDCFIDEMRSSGFDYISVGILKKESVLAMFSCPLWQQFYLEKECLDLEPLVTVALLNIDTPIDWHSLPIIEKEHSFIMQSRKQITGCDEGLSIVKKIGAEDDTVAILAFGTKGTFSNLVDGYFKHKNQLLKLVETIAKDLTEEAGLKIRN